MESGLFSSLGAMAEPYLAVAPNRLTEENPFAARFADACERRIGSSAAAIAIGCRELKRCSRMAQRATIDDRSRERSSRASRFRVSAVAARASTLPGTDR